MPRNHVYVCFFFSIVKMPLKIEKQVVKFCEWEINQNTKRLRRWTWFLLRTTQLLPSLPVCWATHLAASLLISLQKHSVLWGMFSRFGARATSHIE